MTGPGVNLSDLYVPDLLLNLPQFKSRLSPVIFGSFSSFIFFLFRSKIVQNYGRNLVCLTQAWCGGYEQGREKCDVSKVMSDPSGKIMIPVELPWTKDLEICLAISLFSNDRLMDHSLGREDLANSHMRYISHTLGIIKFSLIHVLVW